MKKYLLLLAVAATVGFTSCSKDDDEVSSKSKTEYLTASGWKFSSITINPGIDFDGDGTAETDLFTGQDDCDADDLYVFKADKTYTNEEGATKCDPTDDQVYETGTWNFNGDETVLTTLASDSGSVANTYNITELNANTLKYTETFTNGGTTYTVTSTLTH